MKKFYLFTSILIGMGIALSSCSKDENNEPEVDFEVENNHFKVPVDVSFYNTSDANGSSLESFSWDFDDGETSSEENPVHTYTESGFYTVELEVTDGDGNTYTSSRFVELYGNITKWAAGEFRLYDEAWSGETLPMSAYLNVRDSQGNIFDYTGQSEYQSWDEITSDDASISVTVGDYELPLTSGSITFELMEWDGSNTVNPDSDRVIYSVTVHTSDVIPANSAGPYMEYYPGENSEAPYYLDIDWLE